MKTMHAIMLASALVWGNVSAQEEQAAGSETFDRTVVRALYHVTDMLDEDNSREEPWELRVSTNTNTGKRRFTTLKGSLGKINSQDVRTDGRWWNDTRTGGWKTYLHERYSRHPTELDPGEKSFGYVEERSLEDDSVVASGPIFYEVVGAGTMRRLIMYAFLPDDVHLLIIRDYQEGSGYLLPFQESYRIFDGERTVSHQVYERIR